MRKPTRFLPLFLLAVFLAFTACQSGSEEQGEQEVMAAFPLSTDSEEAKSAFEKGLDIWDMGNEREAHAYFAKALAADPNLAIAHLFVGLSAGTGEAFGKGLADAKAHLEGASEYEKQMIAYMGTYATNDAESRLTITKKMAADYPDNARCQINLGDTYWGLNEIESSRASYQKAVDIDPEWTTGYNSLASSYMFAEPKDYAKAQSNASKVVEMAGDNPRAHVLMGDCYRAQNMLEQARDSYAKAIELDPEDFETHYKKGHAETFLGNMEAARTDFQNGRQYDDEKNVGFEAYTFLYAGDPETAMQWMEGKLADSESLGISADMMVEAKLDMISDCGWMAFHLGRADKLAELKAQLEPLSKMDAEGVGSAEALIDHESNMLFWDVLIAATSGNMEEAEAKLAELKASREPIKNPRKLEGYHFAKGVVHMMKEDYSGAAAEFEQGNPDWTYNQYWMAKAHEMAGNQERAAELYRKVAAFNFNGVGNALVRKEVMEKVDAMTS